MGTSASVSGLPWVAFAAAAPEMSSQVKSLFEQYGRAFGYLATIRRDGGPRVHPVSPVFADGGLYCFVLPSPKRGDLERDGRYALHSYPAEHADDEAYLLGAAIPVADMYRVARLAQQHRADDEADWRVFELTVSVAMLTRRPRLGGPPEHRVWHAPGHRPPTPNA